MKCIQEYIKQKRKEHWKDRREVLGISLGYCMRINLPLATLAMFTRPWVGFLIVLIRSQVKIFVYRQLSGGFSCFCRFPLGNCWTSTWNWTTITLFLVHTNSFFTNSPITLCSEFLTVLLNKIRQLHLCLMMLWPTMVHDRLLL